MLLCLRFAQDVEEKDMMSMAGLMDSGNVKEALSTTVHAMSVCRTFYLSYIHTHVRPCTPQFAPSAVSHCHKRVLLGRFEHSGAYLLNTDGLINQL